MSGLQDETKAGFRKAVSDIRERLLNDFSEATDRRYSLSVKDRSKVYLDGLAALQYERLQPSLPKLPALVKERAYTLTNRLVILMSLESRDLRKVKLVSQGVEKSAFRTEQDFFVDLCKGDDAGFGFVLRQVWDQLALELPALFAYDEVLECIPIPGPTLLWLLDVLNTPELISAWFDDTTLGWLYQYWNDPDRKAVDEKLNTTTGKVEAHELANKTQLFTERYMVEWLVQNSLGTQWLCICAKNEWTSDAKTILKNLESRRSDWNKRISMGTELASTQMPVQGAEEYWKFHVSQELGEDSIKLAPNSLQEVKILDPAMGSGHFLVYVFDFLWPLYQEQSRLSGEEYSKDQILAWILTKNLHGIDIDNRAVQIAAAALYIKVKEKNSGFIIPQLHLVASDLGLAHLKTSDPAIQAFVLNLEQELGLAKTVSNKLIDALRGADYMGSLLQIDSEIDRLIEGTRLLGEDLTGDGARDKVLGALRKFIHDHDQGEDLGINSLADQLGKGLRLISVLEQKFDVVMGNPPYLSKGKVDSDLERLFTSDSEELYEVMVFRSKTWLRDHGILAFVTTHNFMFLDQYKNFRAFLYREGNVHSIAQLGVWTFADVSQPGALGIALFTWEKTSNVTSGTARYQRVGKGQHRTDPRFSDKIAYLINFIRVYTFSQSRFAEIPGSPMIYWWPEEFRSTYLKGLKLDSISFIKHGLSSGNNARFVRYSFEIPYKDLSLSTTLIENNIEYSWVPFLNGAKGTRWFDTCTQVIDWRFNGLEIKQSDIFKFPYLKGNFSLHICNEETYFRQGISYNTIGTNGLFCRLRKYNSLYSGAAATVFCSEPEKIQILLSSGISAYVLQSLNPTINNEIADVKRLPVFEIVADYRKFLTRALTLYNQLFASTESNLEYAYQHLDPETFEVEEARIRNEIDKEILEKFSSATVQSIYSEIGEPIFDFSKWDRNPQNIPANFVEVYQASDNVESISRKYRLHPDSILQIKDHLNLEHKTQRENEAFKHLSWAIGVLLGRFDLVTGGLVDLVLKPDIQNAHFHGLLYLSALDEMDGLSRREDRNIGKFCFQTLQEILTAKWGESKAKELWEHLTEVLVGNNSNLNGWIRTEAFGKHKEIYENRPIYFPLVSAKKNFFVWVNIHRWQDGTLQSVLANYLRPDLVLLESRIRRLREESQHVSDKKARNTLEDEIAALDKLLDELLEFVSKVNQLSEKGPAPKIQEVEAPFVVNLDDGVMVNAAALWELVLPLWKEPKKWWEMLNKPHGKKDLDWSHTAMRYWPKRVYEKIEKDPSFAVAHSDYGVFTGRDLFKELHPKSAKKWADQQKLSVEKEPEMELNFESAAGDA